MITRSRVVDNPLFFRLGETCRLRHKALKKRPEDQYEKQHFMLLAPHEHTPWYFLSLILSR